MPTISLESAKQLEAAFERQVENLLQKGYPQAAGVTVDAFVKQLQPLQIKVSALEVPQADLEQGRLPFVIVIKSELVAPERTITFVERQGKAGFAKLYPKAPSDFAPIDNLRIPSGVAYLLADIDRGDTTRNLPPSVALNTIVAANRWPLTIEEGIAILTHCPDFLKKNHCFSLLASRCGDKRVPALWLSDNKPRLGWCWDGNPHTWLGSASCAARVGV